MKKLMTLILVAGLTLAISSGTATVTAQEGEDTYCEDMLGMKQETCARADVAVGELEDGSSNEERLRASALMKLCGDLAHGYNIVCVLTVD